MTTAYNDSRVITDAQKGATAPQERTSVSMDIIHNSCDGTTSFCRRCGELRAESAIKRPRPDRVMRAVLVICAQLAVSSRGGKI